MDSCAIVYGSDMLLILRVWQKFRFGDWRLEIDGRSSISNLQSPISILLGRAKRLVEVPQQVVGVLQADREPDHLGQDASGALLGLAELLMGRAGGVDDQRLGVADVGEVREELQSLDEA